MSNNIIEMSYNEDDGALTIKNDPDLGEVILLPMNDQLLILSKHTDFDQDEIIKKYVRFHPFFAIEKSEIIEEKFAKPENQTISFSNLSDEEIWQILLNIEDKEHLNKICVTNKKIANICRNKSFQIEWNEKNLILLKANTIGSNKPFDVKVSKSSTIRDLKKAIIDALAQSPSTLNKNALVFLLPNMNVIHTHPDNSDINSTLPKISKSSQKIISASRNPDIRNENNSLKLSNIDVRNGDKIMIVNTMGGIYPDVEEAKIFVELRKHFDKGLIKSLEDVLRR